jgi:hypothetical protein
MFVVFGRTPGCAAAAIVSSTRLPVASGGRTDEKTVTATGRDAVTAPYRWLRYESALIPREPFHDGIGFRLQRDSFSCFGALMGWAATWRYGDSMLLLG